MEKSSFFNSVNGDRKYQANAFAEYFNSLVTNGVFPNPSTNLQVLTNNNFTITIKKGKAWINGYMYFNDGDLTIPVNVSDGVLNRIDRVAVRFDTVGRAINTVIIVGIPATNPVAPALQRDVDGYELGIADIYIGKGATSIIQLNITDLRMDTNLCGWVNSLIQADTTAIFAQYQSWYTSKKDAYDLDMGAWSIAQKATYDSWYSTFATTEQNKVDVLQTTFQNDFDTWFTLIQNVLDGDTAGNLFNKINLIPVTYRGTIAPVNPTTIDYWFQELL